MARIRSIHPDALKSHKLADASAEAERLYWRLLTNCDDEGRAEDEPRLLAAYLFPMNEDINASVVDAWLAELSQLGLLVRYLVGMKPYLQVTKWDDYQRPQKPTPSRIPPLPDDYATTPVGVEPGVGVGDVTGEGAIPSSSPSDLQATDPTAVLAEACMLLAERALERTPTLSGNRARHLSAVQNGKLKDYRDFGLRLLHAKPGLTATELAERLEPCGETGPEQVAIRAAAVKSEEETRALLAEIENAERTAPPPRPPNIRQRAAS